MDTKGRVSVVTISFNQANYISQAIESVLNQDYPNVEYIIVDPGSTDGSRDIIERYRDQLDLIVYDPDKGPADGLNKGFFRASGEVFGFINSDDYLLPGAISKVMEVFNEQPSVSVVSGHTRMVDRDGVKINDFYSRRFSLTRFVYGASVLAQQSTFFHADLFRRVGGFNVENRVAWDHELWADFAMEGGCFYILNEWLAAFRLYEGTISASSKNDHLRAEYLEYIFRKIKGRNWRRRDKTIAVAMKFLEYISHPRVLKQRLLYGNTMSLR